MTAPETSPADRGTPTAPCSPKAAVLAGLRRREDFLSCARGARQGMPGFLLQARRRPETEAGATDVRVGFTASRKIGNAVARNRAKRRLRETARRVLPECGVPGWDYVLVARPEATAGRAFDALLDDLRVGLRKIHRGSR